MVAPDKAVPLANEVMALVTPVDNKGDAVPLLGSPVKVAVEPLVEGVMIPEAAVPDSPTCPDMTKPLAPPVLIVL